MKDSKDLENKLAADKKATLAQLKSLRRKVVLKILHYKKTQKGDRLQYWTSLRERIDLLITQIDTIENEQRMKELNALLTAYSKFENQELSGFLKRTPENIRVAALHEGGFLLLPAFRTQIEQEIQANPDRSFLLTGLNVDALGITKKATVYVNKQNEAFVLGPFLGKGGFGSVYIAQNCKTGQWLCMKQLEKGKLEEVELDMLKQEGLFKSSESMSDQDLFIGELIQGENLQVFLTKNQGLSFEQALAINISVVEAYESLQRKGYVHRDIKLANIMRDEKRQQCFAIDFGLTKKTGEKTYGEGTAMYATPEVISAMPANFADDIYAMGLVAAQVLLPALPDIVSYSSYEKLSKFLSAQGDQKRVDYINLIKQKFRGNRRPEIASIASVAEEMHLKIQAVIFGAKHAKYQKKSRMSQAQIDLCALIYEMTGPPEHRKELNPILQEMRRIRLNHIKARIAFLKNYRYEGLLPEERSVASNYNQKLMALYEQREKLAANNRVAKELSPQEREALTNNMNMIDNLDAFLLQAVDSNPRNRPLLNELEKYKQTLDTALATKGTVVKEIQEVPKARQERLETIMASLEEFKKTENPAEPTINKAFRMQLKQEVASLKVNISKGMAPFVALKKAEKLLAIYKNFDVSLAAAKKEEKKKLEAAQHQLALILKNLEEEMKPYREGSVTDIGGKIKEQIDSLSSKIQERFDISRDVLELDNKDVLEKVAALSQYYTDFEYRLQEEKEKLEQGMGKLNMISKSLEASAKKYPNSSNIQDFNKRIRELKDKIDINFHTTIDPIFSVENKTFENKTLLESIPKLAKVGKAIMRLENMRYNWLEPIQARYSEDANNIDLDISQKAAILLAKVESVMDMAFLEKVPSAELTKKISEEVKNLEKQVENLVDLIKLKPIVIALQAYNNEYMAQHPTKNPTKKSGFLLFTNKQAEKSNPDELTEDLKKFLKAPSDPLELKRIIVAMKNRANSKKSFFDANKYSDVESRFLKEVEADFRREYPKLWPASELPKSKFRWGRRPERL